MQTESAETQAKASPRLFRPVTFAALAVVGGLIFGSWWGVMWLEEAGIMSRVREHSGVRSAVALTLVHAAVSITPAPGEPIAIANSSIYGFGWGVLMNWSGWMIAAVVEFFLLRRAIRLFARDHAPAWIPAWLRRLPAGHPLFLIAGRWVPFGCHIVNAAAAAKATFWRHVWCSAIGIIPVAVLFSALANGWRVLS